MTSERMTEGRLDIFFLPQGTMHVCTWHKKNLGQFELFQLLLRTALLRCNSCTIMYPFSTVQWLWYSTKVVQWSAQSNFQFSITPKRNPIPTVVTPHPLLQTQVTSNLFLFLQICPLGTFHITGHKVTLCVQLLSLSIMFSSFIHISVFHSFLLRNDILLYGYVTFW